jgi:hypothetical protein
VCVCVRVCGPARMCVCRCKNCKRHTRGKGENECKETKDAKGAEAYLGLGACRRFCAAFLLEAVLLLLLDCAALVTPLGLLALLSLRGRETIKRRRQ